MTPQWDTHNGRQIQFASQWEEKILQLFSSYSEVTLLTFQLLMLRLTNKILIQHSSTMLLGAILV